MFHPLAAFIRWLKKDQMPIIKTERSVMNRLATILLSTCITLSAATAFAQLQPVVPQEKRGRVDAERRGTHDANNIRTEFWNYGMVGSYPPDPGNVDLSVFHS